MGLNRELTIPATRDSYYSSDRSFGSGGERPASAQSLGSAMRDSYNSSDRSLGSGRERPASAQSLGSAMPDSYNSSDRSLGYGGEPPASWKFNLFHIPPVVVLLVHLLLLSSV